MRKPAIFILALAMSTAAFADEKRTENFERTLNVRPGTSFEIDNVNGSITISGWDRPQVRIQAVKKVHSRDGRGVNEALRALRIEVKQTANGVEVDTVYPRKNDLDFLDMIFGKDINASVQYEISVPRTMNVEADTVNGSIRVTDVSGEIELDTTNGKIDVVNCSGAVDASTTNGGIGVELLSVLSGKEMSFETTNGRITLSVPANLAADINASTTNGSVRSDLPLTTSRFSRTSIRGTLNGGGPEIRLRTTNGGIDIKTIGAASARS
jgi:DUF4097 and DUF4098 domain-containing protein YvlB